MEDDIKKIISESVNAPSGDNGQPWSFRVKGDGVRIYNRDVGANDYLDYCARGTYLAHGALIENISIVASAYKYAVMVKLFPEEGVVSHITFAPNASRPADPLASVVGMRGTNRKRYEKKSLPQAVRDRLLYAALGNATTITCVETEGDKRTLFVAGTQMERIALENERLHRLFFESIVWTPEEEQSKGRGLYLKTMELPPPVQFFFRHLRKWPVARFLSRLKFSSTVAKNNAAQYQSSSAAFVFSVPDGKPETFVELGRAVERVWLTATLEGLAVQPLAGLIYVHQRLAETGNADKTLSDEQVAIVERSYEAIRSVAKSEGTIGMILRVGYASAPSARSQKRPPEFL